jgi:hypothetical protein
VNGGYGQDENDQQDQHDIDQRRHVDFAHHIVVGVFG